MPSRLRCVLITDLGRNTYFYRDRHAIEELANFVSGHGGVVMQQELCALLEGLTKPSKNKSIQKLFALASQLQAADIFRLLITRERRGTYHARETITRMYRRLRPEHFKRLKTPRPEQFEQPQLPTSNRRANRLLTTTVNFDVPEHLGEPVEERPLRHLRRAEQDWSTYGVV